MFKTVGVFVTVTLITQGFYWLGVWGGDRAHRRAVAEACDPACHHQGDTLVCKLIPFDCWDIP